MTPFVLLYTTNTWSANQTFGNITINGTCTGPGCGSGGGGGGSALYVLPHNVSVATIVLPTTDFTFFSNTNGSTVTVKGATGTVTAPWTFQSSQTFANTVVIRSSLSVANVITSTAGLVIAGGSTMSVVELGAGELGAPSLTFGNRTTGFYRSLTNQVGMQSQGAAVGSFSVSGVNISLQLFLANGSLLSPSYTWTNETNSGKYRGGSGIFREAVSGADVFEYTVSSITSLAPFVGRSSFTAWGGFTSTTGFIGQSSTMNYLYVSSYVYFTNNYYGGGGTPATGTVTIYSDTNPSLLHLIGNSINSGFFMTSFGGIPFFNGRAAGGTLASPTATTPSSVVGRFGGTGHTGAAFTGANKASVEFVAAETFSTTNQGTEISLLTTPLGATTQSERMRVYGSSIVSRGDMVGVSSISAWGVVTSTTGFIGQASTMTFSFASTATVGNVLIFSTATGVSSQRWLDGKISTTSSVDWTNVMNKPADFADDTDNTGGGGGASSLAVGQGNTKLATIVSSPTAIINLSSGTFNVNLTGGATAFIDLSSAAKTRVMCASFDGGGSAITASSATVFTIPYDAILDSVTIVAPIQSGEIRAIVKKLAFDSIPGTFASICGTDCPSLSGSTQIDRKNSLTGWDRNVKQNDTFMVVVATNATSITSLTMQMYMRLP